MTEYKDQMELAEAVCERLEAILPSATRWSIFHCEENVVVSVEYLTENGQWVEVRRMLTQHEINRPRPGMAEVIAMTLTHQINTAIMYNKFPQEQQTLEKRYAVESR